MPTNSTSAGDWWARFALPTLHAYTARLAFRIAANTISAARTLGGWSPVDMIASNFAKASTCRCRSGESDSSSASDGVSFSGVQFSWTNSGTTFSPITTLARMIEDPQQKIGRPRQLYTGVTRRDYVDMAKRK